MIASLAVKLTNASYVLSGHDGSSGNYRAAGTVFSYYRPSDAVLSESILENIVAPGPLNASVDIMVITLDLFFTAL